MGENYSFMPKDMIKTPAEIVEQREKMLRVFVSGSIAEIAKALEANYMGEPLPVTLEGDRRQFEKIFDQLRARFDERGWSIRISGS